MGVDTIEQIDDGVLSSEMRLIGKLKRIQMWSDYGSQQVQDEPFQGLHDVRDQKTITAESGQDVILPCRAPNNNIFTLEWERADLKSGNVLFRVGCDIILDDQHPSFKNRVDLQDRQMKDGDVSLILKDVTINDAGTYECHVLMEEAHSFKHSFIKLVVVPPGQTGGDKTEL